MKPYRLLADEASHFMVHDGSKPFPIAKRGLSEATIAKIRSYADGGEVQRFPEGGDVELPTPEVALIPMPDLTQEAISGAPPELDPGAAAAIERSQVEIPTMGDPSVPGSPAWAARRRQAIADVFTPHPGQAIADIEQYGPVPEAAPTPAAPPVAPAAPAPAAPPPVPAPPSAGPDMGGRGVLRPGATGAAPPAPVRRPTPAAYGPPEPSPLQAIANEQQAGANAQMEAVRQQARDQAAQFRAMAGLQELHNQKSAELRQMTMQKLQLWQQQADEMFESARNARVDPGHYWADKNAGAKIGSIIGILLSGLGSGLQSIRQGNTANLALLVLDKAVDNDIEAQKFNVMKQQTLIGQHMQLGMTMMHGAELAKADLRDEFAGDMLKVAYEHGGPEGIAVAEATAQAIRQQNALARLKIVAEGADIQAKNAEIRKIDAEIGSLNVQIQAYRQGLQQQALRSQALLQGAANGQSQRDFFRLQGYPDAQIVDVPGAPGMARVIPGSKEESKSVREMMTLITEGQAGIAELMKLQGMGSSLSPTDRGAAKVWVGALTGLLRLPITGPGAMSEGERKLLQEIIANPTAIFSLSAVNRRKLTELSKVLQNKLLSVLGAYTVAPGISSAPLGPITPVYPED